MPSPKFAMTWCVITLLLGLSFMAGNLYFSGTHHSTLANFCFAFAVISEMAFVGFAFLWVYSKAWTTEPVNPAAPPLGGAGNKQQPKPITQKLPQGIFANKPPGPPAA